MYCCYPWLNGPHVGSSWVGRGLRVDFFGVVACSGSVAMGGLLRMLRIGLSHIRPAYPISMGIILVGPDFR
jgi:hypothetical protein